ncbi:MAG: glyoxalase [Candidatus Saccharibacteria bacterium]|nr:glyoxalase [Candidatus Saccharibacteria bacterium]
MNKVSHFEIPTDNKEESRDFYEAVFGWTIRDVPVHMEGKEGDYTTATTVATDERTQEPTEPGGINGALVDRSGDIKTPVITITVDSIEEHLEQVKQRKGKVVEGRQEVEGMGWYAYVEDPAGNIIGLWEEMKK